MARPFRCSRLPALLAASAIAAWTAAAWCSEPVVPGTGQVIASVGDDFEDPDWTYLPHSPKSSKDIDEQMRGPGGRSKNGRWYEGIKRGHPDVVRRVEPPPGGLEGSTGAMLLQTLHSGVPGRLSYRVRQDDFIADVHYRLGGSIPVWQTPSFVTRVFLPPLAEWERRNGPHFGIRAALDTTVRKAGRGLFATSTTERETYWPGFFVDFEIKKDDQGQEQHYARLRLRADRYGRDFAGPQITQTGWWTFGISVTPDGQVHYYASPGVDDLTEDDYITSRFPYGFRAERFKTFFFNVCNRDDGRSWSSPLIVDDSFVYFIPKKR